MKNAKYNIIVLITLALILNFCQEKTLDTSSRSDYDFYSQTLDSLFLSDRIVVLRDSIVDADLAEYQNNYYLRPDFKKTLTPLSLDSLNTKVNIQKISRDRFNTIKKRSGLAWENFYDAFPEAVGFVTLSRIYHQEELSKAYFVISLECGYGCDRSYEITLGVQ